MSDTTAHTTIITIDWAIRGGIKAEDVERYIDERLGSMIEDMADLCDLTDDAQGIGAEADANHYQRRIRRRGVGR